jgi:hypothetical protein
MRVTILIEAGSYQLVLSPQDDGEKRLLAAFKTGDARIYHGAGFYACQGGWVRYDMDPKDSALIIRVEEGVDDEGAT